MALSVQKTWYCTWYQEIQESISANDSSTVISSILMPLTCTKAHFSAQQVPCPYRVKTYPSSFRTKRKKSWLLKEHRVFYQQLLGGSRAFLWKDDCHITWQQKSHTSSQGKLTMFAWKLQFPSGLLSFSATFHYPWQSQGKHDGKAVVQLPHSPGILSGKLWDGFCAQCWDLPWVQEFREHSHRRVARVTLRELTWESGTNLEQEKPPGPLGCVCPVPPGVLAIPTCCPRCELTQPLWDAGLGSLTSAHCRAAQEQHLRAQSPAWAAVPLPSSCPPHPALAALPEPLPTPLCITPPPAPLFPSNRQLRHSRNTFGKASSTGAGITSCLKPQGNPFYCNILDILTYFSLPPPTLHPLKHT